MVIQRGTCTFARKAELARAAGYAGVVIFNEGQEGRRDSLSGSLGGESAGLPVVGASYEVGRRLVEAARAGNHTVRLTVSARTETQRTHNLLAETGGGGGPRPSSLGRISIPCPRGLEFNDNGSGVALVLELALAMARLHQDPPHRLRFAFWGAEEVGLLGSRHHVASLDPEARARILGYLNFDMVGSINHVRHVHDGDPEKDPPPVGSARIERAFLDHFAAVGVAAEPTGLRGGSDYAPFLRAGLPVGGLYSGAGEIKSEAQAEAHGGRAGAPFDPCYHKACDTIANISDRALAELSAAAAHALATLANGDWRHPSPAQRGT